MTDWKAKPYHWIAIPQEDGGFFSTVLEFPGCFAEGATAEESMIRLQDVGDSWLEAAQRQGQTIPDPFAGDETRGSLWTLQKLAGEGARRRHRN